jgi:hypothetical protein
MFHRCCLPGWRRRRPGRMAVPVYSAALAHGLCGNDRGYRDWRARAHRVDGSEGTGGNLALTRNLAGFATFADCRVALHSGRLDEAVAAAADLFTGTSWKPGAHGSYDAYPRALAVETAVLAGLPSAAGLLAAAAPLASQSTWAAACLARAAGRLHGDRAALHDSVARWERIGARFERACTLLLLDDEAAREGLACLEALGCEPPAR